MSTPGLQIVITLTTYRRFPIVSGFRIEWDSRRPPNQRVIGIWEEEHVEEEASDDISIHSGTATPNLKSVKGAEVSRQPGGKTYSVVTREYMATGHDGYEALKDCKYVGGLDDEHGQLMSSIVRKYLLGTLGSIAHIAGIDSKA